MKKQRLSDFQIVCVCALSPKSIILLDQRHMKNVCLALKARFRHSLILSESNKAAFCRFFGARRLTIQCRFAAFFAVHAPAQS